MDPSPLPPSVPPSASADANEKIWMVLSHLSLLLGVGFLLPLVVYLVKKDTVPATAEHAREALNFHISLFIYGIVGVALCLLLVGFVVLLALLIFSIIFSIIAAVKSSEGVMYRYPLTLRLIP